MSVAVVKLIFLSGLWGRSSILSLEREDQGTGRNKCSILLPRMGAELNQEEEEDGRTVCRPHSTWVPLTLDVQGFRSES